MKTHSHKSIHFFVIIGIVRITTRGTKMKQHGGRKRGEQHGHPWILGGCVCFFWFFFLPSPIVVLIV